MPGIVCIGMVPFQSYAGAELEMSLLNEQLKNYLGDLEETPLIVVCDDAHFCGASLKNFLWVSFTRCNPSHDIYGVDSFTAHKHWGCRGPLIIDARIKPHHAPVLNTDKTVEKRIERLFEKGASLYGI